jgi:hypothetical protein
LGEEECIKDIGGKPEGKSPLERSRRRWLDDIKMDLRDTGHANTLCVQNAGIGNVTEVGTLSDYSALKV